MKKQLLSLSANIRTFSNFFAIYLSRIKKIPLGEIVLRNGARFAVLNTNNNLGTIHEVFTQKEYQHITELSNINRPVLVDIGANIGVFTVWAAGILPTAELYSYEPEEKNFLLLRENIVRNGIASRAHAFHAAVCGKEGTRTLSIAGESSGKNSLAYAIGGGATEQVQATTLNRIFEENNLLSCDCIKIDCEGAEYEILYNTAPEHLAKVRMMIVEHHGVEGESVAELTQFLIQYQFSIEHSKEFGSMFTARRVGQSIASKGHSA